jgi:hypothetical protein
MGNQVNDYFENNLALKTLLETMKQQCCHKQAQMDLQYLLCITGFRLPDKQLGLPSCTRSWVLVVRNRTVLDKSQHLCWLLC